MASLLMFRSKNVSMETKVFLQDVVTQTCEAGKTVTGLVGFDTSLHGVYVRTMLSCNPE